MGSDHSGLRPNGSDLDLLMRLCTVLLLSHACMCSIGSRDCFVTEDIFLLACMNGV